MENSIYVVPGHLDSKAIRGLGKGMCHFLNFSLSESRSLFVFTLKLRGNNTGLGELNQVLYYLLEV
jgi:hypothetical protein